MGSDCCLRDLPASFDIFNSRSPHGERPYPSYLHPPKRFFNSLSPYGERPDSNDDISDPAIFNSRSPYGERPAYSSLFCTDLNFQFTLPVWGATVVGFSYDFILLLLFISANQEKACFLPCFFGFSSLCCLWFAPAALILFFRW